MSSTAETVVADEKKNPMMVPVLSKDERQFIRHYNKRMAILATLSVLVLAISLFTAYSGKFNLKPKSVRLETVEERLIFTLRFITIQLVWIIASIFWVILKRIGTPALDPMNGYEHLVQSAKNILTNTIEHGIVFIISQLILATDLSPQLCGQMIPALNILYLFGRIAYLIGYPSFRTFGFVIFNFLIIICVSCNVYCLTKMYV